MTLRLVVFDVDGTLVDSQADIVAAMGSAFDAAGADVPSRAHVLSIVGLSVPEAIARLAPQLPADTCAKMVGWYKEAYFLRTQQDGPEPLFAGAKEALQRLNSQDDIVLGTATGKSRRGLDRVIEAHGLDGMFVTKQTGDFHPSKPHPDMLRAALAEAGVGPDAAVMVGDTSYDMDMAQAAGVIGIGVDWGYHSPDALTAASSILSEFDELPVALSKIWGIDL